VGKGQLDWKLRSDQRVRVMEGINAREGFDLPEPVDIVVADVSFISLRLALPPSFRHLNAGGVVVALVKPQFEAGREAVEKGGIVRDNAARVDAVLAVAEHFARHGAGVVAAAASRVAGREGNREIFVHAVKGSPGLEPDELRGAVDRAAA
jgi:23S rRNA (cytidine1920-2'-O)/16S rRNA (cytidine1409-2'-O)-methyltransferase